MRRSRSQGPVSLTNVPNSKTKSRGFRRRRSLSPGAPADRRRPGLDRPGRHRTVQRELALLRRRHAVKRPENDLSTRSRSFRAFFFDETGDTDQTSPENNCCGGWTGVFKLTQSGPRRIAASSPSSTRATRHTPGSTTSPSSEDPIALVEDAGRCTDSGARSTRAICCDADAARGSAVGPHSLAGARHVPGTERDAICRQNLCSVTDLRALVPGTVPRTWPGDP